VRLKRASQERTGLLRVFALGCCRCGDCAIAFFLCRLGKVCRLLSISRPFLPILPKVKPGRRHRLLWPISGRTRDGDLAIEGFCAAMGNTACWRPLAMLPIGGHLRVLFSPNRPWFRVAGRPMDAGAQSPEPRSFCPRGLG
jgi:hypothetical protein